MSIKVDNLLKRYGELTVLDHVSFDVADGEFVSILGPSGCGKTTTLRCIAGLDDSQEGTIWIGDKLVMAPDRGLVVPPHERDLGMVFQSYAVWPHMSVAENVAFPLKARKLAAAEIGPAVDAALDIVGMRELKRRMPAELSGGQQQRVALARAIVGRPKVLLFDEPLSNLDAKLREGTRGEIRRLQRELGVAALYVTHDQEEALSMSDRVIVMERGRVRQIGTPKDLYRRPCDRFVADFVGRASFIALVRNDQGDWSTSAGAPVRVAFDAPPELRRCQIMLRPENMTIQPDDGTPNASPDLNRLTGRIAGIQYLGPHTEYLVEGDGWNLKVHSRRDLQLGASTRIDFDPNDGLLAADTLEQPGLGTS